MTITKRIILILVVALMALIFVGSFGIRGLYQSQQRFEAVQTNTIPSILEIYGARGDFFNERIQTYRYLIATSESEKNSIATNIQNIDQSLDKHLATYERDDISDDTDKKLLEASKADLAAYRAVRTDFETKVKAGDTDAAKAMLLDGGAMFTAGAKLTTAMNAHVDYNLKLSGDTRQENNAAYTQAFWILIAIIAVAVIISATLGFQLYRIVQRGLSGLQGTLQSVSSTLDLTNAAKVERMDEIGKTAAAFNTLLARVGEVVGEVRHSAASVSVATKQIASGNVDLSARTEQQAASLEETAASMEELTTTVKQNTDSARQASMLALNATEISDTGNQVVKRMVETMGEITASSGKIAEITSLIEGIAFQTNILALNAAVEAARAGEQGRGFAVVATEVRTLAQRSSAAAKEIKDLIEKSVATIQEGSSQAAEVGRTTDEAGQAVRRVADIIGEIAAASEEQGRGIEQVNQAVSQMDQVTQQNAALVEEAAAAAQSLEAQAEKMDEMVSVFTVNGTASRRSANVSKPSVQASQRTEPKRDAKPQALRNAGRKATLANVAQTEPSTPDTWETF